jgi:geranylgeranyl pyrophosphate synthase
MNKEWKPDENDIKTVLEAHGLLPTGDLLAQALDIAELYADRIQQALSKFPPSVDKRKALLAILEEGLMQEGIIPNNHERIYKV